MQEAGSSNGPGRGNDERGRGKGVECRWEERGLEKRDCEEKDKEERGREKGEE